MATKAAKSKKKGNGAPKRAAQNTTSIAAPALRTGEKYIGAIIDADGKGHHVILLAGDKSGSWQEMMDWAKKSGGDLPDRVEQALLFRDHKGEFQADYYWSNTQHAGDSDSAWGQGFGYGSQYDWRKDDSCRARAVRRLPIQ